MQPVFRGLEQRAAHTHDGVEHRQQQGTDERDADQVLDPAGVSEDVIGEAGVQGQRVGGLERCPEHGHEDDGGGGIDEQAVEALGGEGDLGVPMRVTALGDVAGGRLHADAVPAHDEEPTHDEGEAGRLRIGEVEARDVGPMEGAGLEDRQDDQQGDRHHGDDPEDGGEAGAEADPQVAGDEQNHQPDQGDDQHPDALRRAEAPERIHQLRPEAHGTARRCSWRPGSC